MKMIFWSIFTIFSIVRIQTPKVHKHMEVGRIETGKIEEDGGLVYYSLAIPAGIEKGVNTLVFRVKEGELSDKAEDDFSDPDIYVSKVKILFNYFND
jgi:hypothetical protein